MTAADFEPFGFDGREPVPCSERAENLACAVMRIITAGMNLGHAKDKVPDYTGQWNPEDHYATEQEEMYRASEALEILIDGRKST